MTSQLVLLRTQILAAIQAYQTSPGFVYNAFTAAASHIPFQKVEDPAAKAGKCWVIGSVVDDGDRKTRAGIDPLVTREIHVQVAYQQTDVGPDDITTLDTLLCLVEQFRDVVKNWNYTFADFYGVVPLWTRNETLRDPNGVPYHYYMLREVVTFESYFTACFTIPHQ